MKKSAVVLLVLIVIFSVGYINCSAIFCNAESAAYTGYKIISFENGAARIQAPKGGSVCIVAAGYEGKVLCDIKIMHCSLSAGENNVYTGKAQGSVIKLILWSNVGEMTPLCPSLTAYMQNSDENPDMEILTDRTRRIVPGDFNTEKSYDDLIFLIIKTQASRMPKGFCREERSFTKETGL